MFRRVAIFLISILFFNSCAPTRPANVLTLLPPTQTLTLTPILTNTSTKTPNPSATWTVSATPHPSLSPLPTISYDVREDFYYQHLLETNGGCRLPCFWGITPGETSLEELEQFVNQNPESIPLDHYDGFYTLYYIYSYWKDISDTVIFFVDDDLIQAIVVRLDTAFYSFPLSKLLNDYGKPDEVFIAQSEDRWINMIVLFENQRIVGVYSLWLKEENKLICYYPDNDQNIVTWAPGKDWLGYVNQIYDPLTDVFQAKSLRPLSEVTDYTISAWFEKLKVRNRSLCMTVQWDKLEQ